jgi:hypothetical protein
VAGWGGIPWGAGPWGAGDLLTVTDAEAVAENAVRVTFNVPVLLDNIGAFDDGRVAENYVVAPLTFGARSVAVAAIELDGAELDSVILRLDRNMSGAPAVYDARVARVRGAAGEVLDPGAAFAPFLGLARFRPPVQPDTSATRYRDFANPQSLRDYPGVTDDRLGQYQVDGTGDIVLDSGVTNIRKRVLRRLLTSPGGFYHLPDYGVGLPGRVKRLMTDVELAALQRDAQRQIAGEPGVEAAEVRVARSGAILRVGVRVKTARGEDAWEMPFTMGG